MLNPGSASNNVFKSFTVGDVGLAGKHYFAGFYEAPAAHSVLTIGGSITQTLGTANEAKGGHVFCVASGAGGAGLVLTVTGVSVTDLGVKNDTDSEVIVANTADAITDQYFETTKKWLGQVTFTLTGTAGAFTFNYGFSKYEDFGNRNFTITDFEIVGHAGANETTLDVKFIHHRASRWTYSAAAFDPLDEYLIDLATDYGTNNDLATGEDFAFKRCCESVYVNGNDGEGIVAIISTAVNNSISSASIHVGVKF